jgi:hypothetical protein
LYLNRLVLKEEEVKKKKITADAAGACPGGRLGSLLHLQGKKKKQLMLMLIDQIW